MTGGRPSSPGAVGGDRAGLLLIPTLAGALCLPATYELSRRGSFPIAFAVVVLVGAAAGSVRGLSKVEGKPSGLHIALAFLVGAFVSELIFFIYYYFTHGYQDKLLTVGIIYALMEFGLIAVVGGVATFAAGQAKPFDV